MQTTIEPAQMRGERFGSLYPADMVKRVMLGIQELRRSIGKLAEAIERGEHIVLTVRGKVFAVITPIGWYREAAKAMKDPTEF